MEATCATRDWSLWSTAARLVLTDPSRLDDARLLVDEELEHMERACSRFRDDSELTMLHRHLQGTTLLSPLLAELVAASLEAARRTGGAVDPTVGSALVDLGYDRDIDLVRQGDRPVALVRRVPGWRTVRLDGRKLTLAPGERLDLGATAKAVAADRCAALVARELGVGVLVSLGGDIATAGLAPTGGWQVAVHDLATDVPAQVTLMTGAAIATSSTARRTWQQGGDPRHHIVDPATCRSAVGPWRAVTVVATSCLRANTATTAALVKGAGAEAWLRHAGVPARLTAHDGSVLRLGGWPVEDVA